MSFSFAVSWSVETSIAVAESWFLRIFHDSQLSPPPPHGDYVHASLGFMDAERGEKEGLGGTSGFNDGVRFNPDLVSELYVVRLGCLETVTV